MKSKICRKTSIIYLLLALITSQGISQDVVRGIVTDKSSNDPVEDVFVSWGQEEETTITNTAGEFSIMVTSFPVILRFSHVSYGVIEIELSQKPPGTITIRLERKVSKIDEVQVSGERLRILTRDDDYSLLDFAFDSKYLWMLGYINNQANRQRLFLANPYGDTLQTITVSRAERLHVDVFGNVHLVLRDSVFQLFSKNDSILFLYGTSKIRFNQAMDGILGSFNNKLVFKNSSKYNMELYYLTMEDPDRHHLAFLSDTLGKMSTTQDRRRDAAIARWGLNEYLANMWTTIGRFSKRGTKFADVISPPIPMELFSSNDSLYILNFFKDSLLCYAPDGSFSRSILIDYHKEIRLGGIDYKELQYITDPVANKVYLAERRIAKWILHPFDISSGSLQQEIPLPDFAGMTGIKAYNDAIYFLYHDKIYPYYTRLYRYQLY